MFENLFQPSGLMGTGGSLMDQLNRQVMWNRIGAAGASLLQTAQPQGSPTPIPPSNPWGQASQAFSNPQNMTGPIQQASLMASLTKLQKDAQTQANLEKLIKSAQGPGAGRARALAAVGDYKGAATALYPDPTKAPTVTGGMQFDPTTNSWQPIPGYVDQQSKIRAAGAPNVSVKVAGEGSALVSALDSAEKQFAATGDPKYRDLANYYRRQLAFKNPPPQQYVLSEAAANDARDALGQLYTRFSEGSRFNPSDRGFFDQQMNRLRLAFATLKQRGANFTESEQAMIDGILGGDPNSVFQQTTTGGRSAYMDRLKEVGRVIDRESANLHSVQTGSEPIRSPYPWEKKDVMGGGSKADLEYTAQKRGMTVEQVLNALAKRDGITVEEARKRYGAE